MTVHTKANSASLMTCVSSAMNAELSVLYFRKLKGPSLLLISRSCKTTWSWPKWRNLNRCKAGTMSVT